jgi:hypothetical protein
MPLGLRRIRQSQSRLQVSHTRSGRAKDHSGLDLVHQEQFHSDDLKPEDYCEESTFLIASPRRPAPHRAKSGVEGNSHSYDA